MEDLNDSQIVERNILNNNLAVREIYNQVGTARCILVPAGIIF